MFATYEKILFSTPKLAANLAHPILKEVYAELNATFEGIETNEDGMIAEKDLMDLFESKIRILPELKEAHEAEELENAA